MDFPDARLFEILRGVPSLFPFLSVLFFGDVVRQSCETIFILVQSPRFIPATLFPCGFNRVHVKQSIHHEMMMPSDFCIRRPFRDVYVFCRRQFPLFPLIVHPPDVVLHVLDRLIHVLRFFPCSVCQCDPNVRITEILIEQAFHIFASILVIEVLLCFGVISFDSALHRNIIHLFELRIYFHLKLLTCTNLFQGIHTLESVLEHLFHKILVQVIDALVECCLVVIRDECHPPLFLLAFIHLPHTSFHACPHLSG